MHPKNGFDDRRQDKSTIIQKDQTMRELFDALALITSITTLRQGRNWPRLDRWLSWVNRACQYPGETSPRSAMFRILFLFTMNAPEQSIELTFGKFSGPITCFMRQGTYVYPWVEACTGSARSGSCLRMKTACRDRRMLVQDSGKEADRSETRPAHPEPRILLRNPSLPNVHSVFSFPTSGTQF